MKKFLAFISLNYRALSAPTQNKVKNIFKIIWWFKKNAILLSFGEVAEWSIAAVLKTVELRGSGGSNPSLSAQKTKNIRSAIALLMFFMSISKC